MDVRSLKGFGGFTVVLLLLCSIVVSHINNSRGAANELQETVISEGALNKIALLRNAIQRSYAKINSTDTQPFETAVETELAEEYGVDIAIDGIRAVVVDQKRGLVSEFFLIG